MKLGEPEQEAVPVRCCCCGLDWITEPEISTDSTGRQKDTVNEDRRKSLYRAGRARASDRIWIIFHKTAF